MFEIDLTQASNELGKNILNNNKKEFYTLLKNQPELLKNHSYVVDMLTIKNAEDFIYYFKNINEYEKIDLHTEVNVISEDSANGKKMSLLTLFLKYSRVDKIQLLNFFLSEEKEIFKDKIGKYCNVIPGKKPQIIEFLIKNKLGINDKMSEKEMFCFHVFWFFNEKKLFNQLITHEDFDKYYVCKCQIEMLAERCYEDAQQKIESIISCFSFLLSEDEFYKIYNEVKENIRYENHKISLIDKNLGNFIDIIKEKQFLKSGLYCHSVDDSKQISKRL